MVSKLVVTLALVGLVLAVLLPKVVGLGRAARASLAGGSPMPPFADLAFPPAVSVTALLTATTLAVVKPGGRLRGRRRPTAEAETEQDSEQSAGRR